MNNESDYHLNCRKKMNFFEKFIHEVNKDKPQSKITNKKNFWKDTFYTTVDNLDPRPDSEVLIETLLQYTNARKYYNILELGVGSGCLLFSIYKELPKSYAVGLEKNHHTCLVAQKNKTHLRNNKIICGNWCNIHNRIPNIKFDIIISNPPYIKSIDINKLNKNVSNFDPFISLNGGHNGLYCYQQLLNILPHYIHKNSLILLEIGCGQLSSIKKIFSQFYQIKSMATDLQNIPRCVVLQKFH